MSPPQVVRGSHNGSVDNADFGSQGPEALQMLVDGTAADVAAPGQRYLRLLILAEQSSQQIIGSPDFLDKFIVHTDGTNGGAADPHRMAVDPLYYSSDNGNCL